MTVKDKTLSAVRWTSLAALTRAFLQIGQVAALARLVSAEDYGLIAMIGVTLSFAGMFADLGVSSAYVHKQTVTDEQRSSLFWLNVGVGLLLALIIFFGRSLLAIFFNDERVSPLLVYCAPIFFLSAMGQQIRMTAEKELNFKPVMVIEVVCAFVGFLFSVSLAIIGYGAYSLVISALISAGLSTLLSWFYLSGKWRPTFHFRTSDIVPFLGFGSGMVLSNMANQVSMSLDLLLGGRLLTTTQLGTYSVPRNLALQIQLVVNPIVTRVGFPLIAKVQSDVNRVKAIYLKTLNMTASVNAPIYLGVAFFSAEVVSVVLGEKWILSVDLLRVFSIWGALRSIGNPAGSLLFGLGRTRLAVKWNVGFLVVALAFLHLGAMNGPMGLAFSLLIYVVVQFLAGWLFIIQPLCNASFLEYSTAALRPFALSGFAVASSYVLVVAIESSLFRLVLGVLFSTLFYMVFSYKFNRDWIRSIFDLIGRNK